MEINATTIGNLVNHVLENKVKVLVHVEPVDKNGVTPIFIHIQETKNEEQHHRVISAVESLLRNITVPVDMKVEWFGKLLPSKDILVASETV